MTCNVAQWSGTEHGGRGVFELIISFFLLVARPVSLYN